MISLTPSCTEMVAAVGARELLVGVDQFSSYPPEVQSLPKMGDFLQPNLEAIVAAGSDIVLLDSVQSRVIEALKAAGIRTLAISANTIEDVRKGLLEIGKTLGHEAQGRAAVAELDARLEAETQNAAKALERSGHRPRVLFIVDRRPGGLAGMVAAGPGTYIDDLLQRAGAENALKDAPSAYVQISAEEVISRAPEVILDALHDSTEEKARADWSILTTVPAVKNGKVILLNDQMFVSPGPRLHLALARLVQILW